MSWKATWTWACCISAEDVWLPWTRITWKPWRWRRSLSSLAKFTSAVDNNWNHYVLAVDFSLHLYNDASVLDLQETSTTVAGAAWVSAKRRKLWRSLSSAAFLAVALICATVTWWHKGKKNKKTIHVALQHQPIKIIRWWMGNSFRHRAERVLVLICGRAFKGPVCKIFTEARLTARFVCRPLSGWLP